MQILLQQHNHRLPFCPPTRLWPPRHPDFCGLLFCINDILMFHITSDNAPSQFFFIIFIFQLKGIFQISSPPTMLHLTNGASPFASRNRRASLLFQSLNLHNGWMTVFNNVVSPGDKFGKSDQVVSLANESGKVLSGQASSPGDESALQKRESGHSDAGDHSLTNK
ncbi:hypothetical protein ACOSQ4_020778 [Xanthoceras sorbifolium]